jgi:hypothetical protein
MKVATFGKDFKMTIPPGKELFVMKNKKYIFSDFVLKQFVDAVKDKGGMDQLKEMIKSIEEIDSVFPVLNLGESIEELKKINTLVIIRTGGIGDLLALSNVAKLAMHIFRDILKVKTFKVLFITDQKYAAVFRYFDQMVTPIYYFYDPIEKVLKKHNIFSTRGVRCIYFEGLIEEREDNWFELQLERMNLRKFALKDQIKEEYKIKNPKLIDTFSAQPSSQLIKKYNITDIENKFKEWKKSDTKTILIHHRASAWIRSFNLGDVITALDTYFKDKNFDNYRIITLPRNYTKGDNEYFSQLQIDNTSLHSKIEHISTENLHQFFYIIAKSDVVISSDTAAFHFKEGIGGYGIGLYSSFPSRMRTKTYVNTHSYDILFPDCKFVSNKDEYVGCTSHFKTPYEICTHVAEKYKEFLTSDHHFKRGNRIPDQAFVKDLESFVGNVGMETLLNEGVFQYAPCLSSLWNPLFMKQLLAIFETENLYGHLMDN